MKNETHWRPSKFVQSRGVWRASRSRSEVAIASRLCVDLVGHHYSTVIPEYANGAFLDLGCGKCPLYGLYRKYVHEVTCVDWEHSLHGHTHIDVEADLNQPLPLADAGFDTILSSDVIEHLAEPDLFFSEVSRMLRPSGYLLLNTPFAYPLHEAPHDYFRYTAYALRRLCEKHGLAVVSLKPLGGYPEVFADMSAKLFSRIPFVGGVLAAFVQAVTCRLHRSFRLSLSESYSFPLMYALVAQKKPKQK
jgi:SAM-dependent methyltransferase